MQADSRSDAHQPAVERLLNQTLTLAQGPRALGLSHPACRRLLILLIHLHVLLQTTEQRILLDSTVRGLSLSSQSVLHC